MFHIKRWVLRRKRIGKFVRKRNLGLTWNVKKNTELLSHYPEHYKKNPWD